MLGCLLLLLALNLFQKGKFNSSLMLFFLFITNGYQVIPVEWLMYGLPLDKGTDLAVLYVIIIFAQKFRLTKKIITAFPVLKLCVWLVVFVALDAAYSLLILDYSLANVIQVFRPYLIFLVFPVFFAIPVDALKKTLNQVAFITVFQSILFLVQVVTGIVLLRSSSGSEEVHTSLIEGYSYVRFYNTPIFLNLALFYFLFVYEFKNVTLKYAVLGVLFLAVIGPMHRSLILTIVAVISIYVLLKKSSGKGMLYFSLIGLGVYAVSFIDVVGDRLNGAFSDMTAALNSDLSVQYIDVNENNLIFRIGHFTERFQYVAESFWRWIFGIGLISDNAPYAAQLPFQFGLMSESTGRIAQIDTGDITWSPLILNLGFLGAILYLVLFARLMFLFYKRSDDNSYAIIGFLLILSAFLTSMAGVEIINMAFRTMALLLLVIVCKDQPKLMIARDKKLAYAA